MTEGVAVEMPLEGHVEGVTQALNREAVEAQ